MTSAAPIERAGAAAAPAPEAHGAQVPEAHGAQVPLAPAPPAAVVTAREAGLVACRRCTRVWPMGTARCGRCGEHLASRDDTSLQRVWAWWVAGVIAYIPAVTLPMLSTRLLFDTQEATIVGGAVELYAQGAWFVASVVLFASIGIPVAKFVSIAWLARSVRRPTPGHDHRRQRLYHVVEFIGRWSMIDVFVVAITSALVQFNVLVYVNPGPASIAFALSVIFTMLSARAFDPRLIWDRRP